MVAKLRCRFLVHTVGAAEEAQHADGADGRIADLRQQRLGPADLVSSAVSFVSRDPALVQLLLEIPSESSSISRRRSRSHPPAGR